MVPALPIRRLMCILGATFLLAGCGGVKLETVEGKASAEGQALTDGSLLFKPDASKGNTSTLEPAGNIDAQGVYKIFTNQKPGAPPGWYKVIVIAQEPMDPKDVYAARKSLINAKYNTEQTTDLMMEVKASPPPGAYDLNLKK